VTLIVKPRVGDYWLSKTLIDGGSSINIMYLETFNRLKLADTNVEPAIYTFHGIVPGNKAYPIGRVTLPVTFGSPSNFRTEKVMFELVDFRSPYHCVIGRQTIAKFMEATHYAYNMMNIPGPRGTITVQGDSDAALACEEKGTEIADAVIAAELDAAEELAKLAEGLRIDNPTILKKPTKPDYTAPAFEASKDTRYVDLVESNSSQQIAIGTKLTEA
jgi:hypothetical protein